MENYPFKRQPHKMVEHTQTIRRQFPEELFVFDYFVGLKLKGLTILFVPELVIILLVLLN